MWQQEGRGGQTHTTAQSFGKCSIPEGVGTSSSFQEERHSRFWCQGQAMVMVGHQTHQPPGRVRYSTAHRMKQAQGAEKGIIAFAEP